MAKDSRLSRRVRFGAFELDLLEGELRRQGLRVKLNEKPFHVLSLLVDRAGHLVRREELRQHLWPADTYVDFDANLNTALSTLRHTLGDSSDNPIFIETVPRQGYRFIAPVMSIEEIALVKSQDFEDAIKPSGESTRQRPKVMPVSRRLVSMIGAAAMLALLASIAYFRWQTRRTAAASGVRKVTILVTPFENLSGDPSQEYLSDGLTDEMITRLGQSAQERLSVIARSTSMQYKGIHKPVEQIAREQHVDFVLDGCMRRQGDRVRVTAQLFGTSNVLHASARSYAARSQVDPRVYDAYLKGLFQLNKRTPDSLRKSIELFRGAIQMDSHFSAAYASLAESYEVSAGWDFLRPEEAFPMAKEAARKAVALDDGLSAAHAAYADVLHEYDWNWAEAEREYKRALALNPSSATGHRLYTEYLTHAGHYDEALSEIQQAQQLDPLSLITQAMVCFVYNHWRQYDNAIQACERTIDLDRSFVPAHYFLAEAYTGKRMYPQALNELRAAAELSGDASMAQVNLAYVYAASGDKEKATQALKVLLKRFGHSYVSPHELAGVYAALGERDEAFTMLDRACEQRSSELMFLAYCPCLDSLHGDTRFKRMVDRIGFPSATAVN